MGQKSSFKWHQTSDNSLGFSSACTRWSYPYITATQDSVTGYFPPKGQAFFNPTANASTYSSAEYELSVVVKDKTIQGLSIQDKSNNEINERELISQYYKDYVASLNPKPVTPKQSENPKRIEQPAPKQNTENKQPMQTSKTFSRSELAELAAQANQSLTLYQQIAYGSKGNSVDEKLELLKEEFNKNKFWDKGIELEDAKPSIKKENIEWYNFVVSFLDSIDSAYSFQIMALNMIQSGKASEQEINAAKTMAAQNSAKALQLYKVAKATLPVLELKQ